MTPFYTIPLTYEELRDTSVEAIRRLAERPRSQHSFVMPWVCEKAVQWYRQAIEWVETHSEPPSDGKVNCNFKKGWRMPPCVKALQEAVLPDGIRHKAYIALARFYGWNGMHPDEMLERIDRIDSKNPIRDPDSIERAVKFGYEHPGFPGCDNSALMRYCQKDTCFYARLRGSRTADPGMM